MARGSHGAVPIKTLIMVGLFLMLLFSIWAVVSIHSIHSRTQLLEVFERQVSAVENRLELVQELITIEEAASQKNSRVNQAEQHWRQYKNHGAKGRLPPMPEPRAGSSSTKNNTPKSDNSAAMTSNRDNSNSNTATSVASSTNINSKPDNGISNSVAVADNPLIANTPILSYQTKLLGTDPAVLVVGGTDGSGTRRVVQILSQLGVTMVSEDPETYDIHGDIMGGWPTIVSPVISATHSLNYSPKDLPAPIQSNVGNNLRRLLTQAERDSHKPQSFVLARGGALPKPKGSRAKNIQYGFKAPVAMTLSPWWHEVLPNFRFLHVLRDGRDIAFSANQGPVEKFYRAMYTSKNDLSLPPAVKATKLWSDWNSQVNIWAKNTINKLDEAAASSVGGKPSASASASASSFNLRGLLSSKEVVDGSKSLGYYAIHSEDLVSPYLAVRFLAISDLADWVGSTVSEDDMCCLSVIDSEFMGSHDRTERNAKTNSAKAVSSRYGKWKAHVKGNENLEQWLNDAGKDGLELFGYLHKYDQQRLARDNHGAASEESEEEASLRLEQMTAQSRRGYICNKTPQDCGAPAPPKMLTTNELEEKYTHTKILEDLCDIYEQVDFKGPDITAIHTVVNADPSSNNVDPASSSSVLTNAAACCTSCNKDSQCRFFTFDHSNNMCYLKSSEGVISDGHKTLTSGIIHRKW